MYWFFPNTILTSRFQLLSHRANQWFNLSVENNVEAIVIVFDTVKIMKNEAFLNETFSVMSSSNTC